MSKFTYEFEKRTEALETYEWDNVWWDHANTENVPRVLYIGDSISCATRIAATKAAENEIFFDGFGTSKAVDNPYFFESVCLFARQQGTREAVMFNNGLHGWHLDDETEYPKAYEELLKRFLKEFEGVPMLILLTTHVSDPERDARVQVRNKMVKAIAEKYNLPTVDFYAITKENEHTISGDGVHLTQDGYKLLAEAVVKKIRELTA